MAYEVAILSKKGDKLINEDYCSAIEGNGICGCILADGLGGFEAGEYASRFVVAYIESKLKEHIEFSKEYVKKLITEAHQALMKEQKTEPNKSQMRSTVVLLILKGNQGIYGYTGDSRLYVLNNKKIVFKTKDHSVCQSLVNIGELEEEAIRFHEDKNKILKVLGQEEGFSVSTGDINLNGSKKNISFLLCSDGVWENLDTLQLELEYCKSKSIEDWLKHIELLILLNGKNNMDNYSMVGVGIR